MNKTTVTLRLLISCLAGGLVCGGCATPTPPISAGESQTHFLQLSDEYWVDLSDAREVIFYRSDATSGTGSYTIQIMHKGTPEGYGFGFSDQATAYTAWRKLTAALGGTLHEDQWKITPVAAVPTIKPMDTKLFGDSMPYPQFQNDLNLLTACRNQHLITDAEYQRMHDQAVADFTSIVAAGNTYNVKFERLQSELGQLEAAKKSHLLTDDQVSGMRSTILSRYGGLAPQ